MEKFRSLSVLRFERSKQIGVKIYAKLVSSCGDTQWVLETVPFCSHVPASPTQVPTPGLVNYNAVNQALQHEMLSTRSVPVRRYAAFRPNGLIAAIHGSSHRDA
jgi:hypothetical protein